MPDLYRVLREKSTPQNRDRGERPVEVLYCGYDRAEALRVYHTHKPEEHGGGYADPYTAIRFQRKAVTC